MDQEREESRKEDIMDVDQHNEIVKISSEQAAPQSVDKQMVSKDLDKVLEDYVEAIGKEKVSNPEDALLYEDFNEFFKDKSRDQLKPDTWGVDIDLEPTSSTKIELPKLQPIDTDILPPEQCNAKEKKEVANEANKMAEFDRYLEDYIEAVRKEKDSGTENEMSFIRELLMEEGRDESKKERSHIVVSSDDFKKIEDKKQLKPFNRLEGIAGSSNHMINNGKYQTEKKKRKGEKQYECVVCKKKFSQKSNLRYHLRTHTGEKPFECVVCKKKFSQNSTLKSHIRTHTGEKPYECDVCNKKFSRKDKLQIHIRTHTGEKPHECDACKKKFSQISHLRYHLRTHIGEKPFECVVCKKKFCHPSTLKDHIKTHTGEKPHGCEVCKEKFSKKSKLQVHIRTHTGEKPYECVVCKKKFNYPSHLKDHIRTHTGEKPYECDVCKKKFRQNSTLKKHVKTHT